MERRPQTEKVLNDPLTVDSSQRGSRFATVLENTARKQPSATRNGPSRAWLQEVFLFEAQGKVVYNDSLGWCRFPVNALVVREGERSAPVLSSG